MVYPLLDGFAQRQRLTLTSNHDNDFPTVQDGLYADSERHARDSGNVVVEEARVRQDGIVCEGLDTCARLERRSGFLQYKASAFCGSIGAKRELALKAMWPSSPIPPRKSAMPPYDLIFSS